jgi:hypothetical protein
MLAIFPPSKHSNQMPVNEIPKAGALEHIGPSAAFKKGYHDIAFVRKDHAR